MTQFEKQKGMDSITTGHFIVLLLTIITAMGIVGMFSIRKYISSRERNDERVTDALELNSREHSKMLLAQALLRKDADEISRLKKRVNGHSNTIREHENKLGEHDRFIKGIGIRK